MIVRHPLDNSPPRLSDMIDRDAVRRALIDRDADSRARWLRNREKGPGLFARIATRLTGRA